MPRRYRGDKAGFESTEAYYAEKAKRQEDARMNALFLEDKQELEELMRIVGEEQFDEWREKYNLHKARLEREQKLISDGWTGIGDVPKDLGFNVNGLLFIMMQIFQASGSADYVRRIQGVRQFASEVGGSTNPPTTSKGYKAVVSNGTMPYYDAYQYAFNPTYPTAPRVLFDPTKSTPPKVKPGNLRGTKLPVAAEVDAPKGVTPQELVGKIDFDRLMKDVVERERQAKPLTAADIAIINSEELPTDIISGTDRGEPATQKKLEVGEARKLPIEPSDTSSPTISFSSTPTVTPSVTISLPGGGTVTSSTSQSVTATLSATGSITGTQTVTVTTSVTRSASGSVSSTHTETSTVSTSLTGSVTATETKSETVTPTYSTSPTGTQTQTGSVTASTTVTTTPSASGTGTDSVSVSSTVTVSPTGTETASTSVSYSSSLTMSQTASMSATETQSALESATASRSATVTKSVSSTESVSATDSSTKSSSVTTTPSVSGTGTDSVTKTSSITPSRTGSGSDSKSTSVSATSSESFSSTLSRTRSQTPSRTISESLSAIASQSVTVTRSITSTVTPSETETITITPTFSTSPSGSVTQTGSVTATKTRSPTGILTSSITKTVTPSGTKTVTVTPTFSTTPTGSTTTTGSVTETETTSGSTTVTQTVTRSSSNAITKSVTKTVTPSETRTLTLTPSPGPSPSGSVTAVLEVSASGSSSPTSSISVVLDPSEAASLSASLSVSPSISASLSATESATASKSANSATPSPSDSATPSTAAKGGGKSNLIGIVAGVAGAVAGLVVVALVGYAIYKKHQENQRRMGGRRKVTLSKETRDKLVLEVEGLEKQLKEMIDVAKPGNDQLEKFTKDREKVRAVIEKIDWCGGIQAYRMGLVEEVDRKTGLLREKIESNNVEIEGLTGKVEAKEAEIKRLKDELHLASNVTNNEITIRRNTTAIVLYNEKIESLKKANRESEGIISGYDIERTAAQALPDDYKGLLAQKERNFNINIDRLVNDMKAQNRQIAALKKDINTKRAKLGDGTELVTVSRRPAKIKAKRRGWEVADGSQIVTSPLTAAFGVASGEVKVENRGGDDLSSLLASPSPVQTTIVPPPPVIRGVSSQVTDADGSFSNPLYRLTREPRPSIPTATPRGRGMGSSRRVVEQTTPVTNIPQ